MAAHEPLTHEPWQHSVGDVHAEPACLHMPLIGVVHFPVAPLQLAEQHSALVVHAPSTGLQTGLSLIEASLGMFV